MALAPNHHPSETVRLWTFQQKAVAATLAASGSYRATWDETPANWRVGYLWIAQQLAEFTQRKLDYPPVWCWHSCNGQLGAAPTVGTATALFGPYYLEQGLVVIELAVPVALALLSSYSDWNEFLNFAIVNQRIPRNRRRARRMFAKPLLKHDTDDIQAVIPMIDAAWVRGITDLVVKGRDRDAALLPR